MERLHDLRRSQKIRPRRQSVQLKNKNKKSESQQRSALSALLTFDTVSDARSHVPVDPSRGSCRRRKDTRFRRFWFHTECYFFPYLCKLFISPNSHGRTNMEKSNIPCGTRT